MEQIRADAQAYLDDVDAFPECMRGDADFEKAHVDAKKVTHEPYHLNAEP
jgi:hypothetical protein